MSQSIERPVTRYQAQATARRRIREKDIQQQETTEREPLSLYEFTQRAWAVLEPTTTFLPNWHIGEICRHLEAITNGDIRKLALLLAPGYMKSLLVNVMWPAWEWAEVAPSTRWMFSSYNESFVARDALKMRDLITSTWYQKRYSDRYQLRRDKNKVLEYHNDRTGFRVSFGVGGGTGHRAHRIVTDDPHKISDVGKDKAREAVLSWWRETMSQRGTSPETGTHVVVMQALHVDDLVHDAMNNLGYEYIRVANEYDPEIVSKTSIGFKDPRTQKGEWAWPERFGPLHKKETIDTLMVKGYASQFQQRPYPAGGDMFKREWCKVLKHPYTRFDAVRYWDLAGTEQKQGVEPAYTAGVLLIRCRDSGRFMVADVRRFRATAAVVERTASNVATHDGKGCKIVIEQEPGSAGKAVIHYYVTRVLAGYAVEGDRPTGDKATRFSPFASQAEVGNVDILEGDWNDDFFTELEQFPNSKFMDQGDAVAGAFNKLTHQRESTTEIMARLIDEQDRAKSQLSQ